MHSVPFREQKQNGSWIIGSAFTVLYTVVTSFSFVSWETQHVSEEDKEPDQKRPSGWTIQRQTETFGLHLCYAAL